MKMRSSIQELLRSSQMDFKPFMNLLKLYANFCISVEIVYFYRKIIHWFYHHILKEIYDSKKFKFYIKRFDRLKYLKCLL